MMGKSESEMIACFNGGSLFSLVTMKQYHSHLLSKHTLTTKYNVALSQNLSIGIVLMLNNTYNMYCR
jgi:hypothetical protein